jgi:SAM-dependent methyltransferase
MHGESEVGLSAADLALVPPAPRLAEPAVPERQGVRQLVRALLRRWRLERGLRRRGIVLRSGDPEAVRAAYERLSPEEFAAFNGLQNWSIGRVLPRVVRAVVPERPCVAVDLGCGSGDSTRWLVRCTTPGSRVLAYDFSAQRLATARERAYVHRDGSRAQVTFVLQGITRSLADPSGRPLAARSVDVALSSGIVGHHLDHDAVARLGAELDRVLRGDGTAVLDSGPRLRVPELCALMRARGFRRVAVQRFVPFNPRAQVVFRRA